MYDERTNTTAGWLAKRPPTAVGQRSDDKGERGERPGAALAPNPEPGTCQRSRLWPSFHRQKMTAHICVWRTQVAGSNWSADVVREPGRAKPEVKAFTTTSFSVGEPRLSTRKGVSSFRSEGLENLTPAVPAATKEEEVRGSSSSEDERDQTHHSGGRGGGTMASLIKRFRESPPLSKADRSSEEGRGDKSLPGFWWREESRRHIEGGLDAIAIAKEEEPAAQDVRGEENEDNQGRPASDDDDEGGSGRDALLRDLEAVLDVGEGEDILQAWRERNRHLLLRRGLLQQEQLEEEMAAEEAVVGEEAEWDGGVGRIPVAVTREGGYRTFIDKLRRRLGMFEDDYGAAANDGDGQAEGEEGEMLEGEMLEVDAASDSEEGSEEAVADEGGLECAPPTVVPSTPVEVEPLIDQVVLERLFCGGPAEEGGGSEEKALSPTALLKDQRYDSDKVVLMLKERILSLQRSMDEDVLGGRG